MRQAKPSFDGSAGTGRPRVVPLRRVPGRTPPPEDEIILDLWEQIDALGAIKSDLEASCWNHPGDDETARDSRFEIGHWMRQIGHRIASLEMIVVHKGIARLVLRDVPAEEVQGLRQAASVLRRGVPDQGPLADVRCAVADVMAAADRIDLRVASGFVLPAARHGAPELSGGGFAAGGGAEVDRDA